MVKADAAKTTTNGVPNGTAHSNSGTAPLGSSYQNSSLTPDGTYRAPVLGGVPSTGYLDSTYGYDTTGAHYAWYDGSAYTNAQQRTTAASHTPTSAYSSNGPSARYQNKSPTPQQTGVHNGRPATTTGSATPTYQNRMYPSTRSYSQYGSSVKNGLSYGSNGYGSSGYGSNGYGSGYGGGYGSNGYDSRLYGRWGVTMDNRYNRPRGRGNGYYGFGNESQDGTIELNRGPRSGRFKNQKSFGHTVTIAVKGQTLPPSENRLLVMYLIRHSST
ncbi:hypothetical protein ACQ4PT_027267 [Festuca glaucescens]